jgi:CheY-like chemotaxis protein
MPEEHKDLLSVLLVEDEVLVRLSIAEDLRQGGLTVLEAAHADEASTILASHAAGIGVVLTDIQMPGSMDGMALARMIRERYPGLRIAVLSGASPKVLAGVPADVVLTKPYDPPQLIRQVVALLERRGANGFRSSNVRST